MSALLCSRYSRRASRHQKRRRAGLHKEGGSGERSYGISFVVEGESRQRKVMVTALTGIGGFLASKRSRSIRNGGRANGEPS
jgi:hypothetical protein